MALSNALRPELHRYAARLMGSVIDGEDVVQDTFARAIEAIDEERDMPSLRAWLFRIAHNRALDLLRAAHSGQPSPSRPPTRLSISQARIPWKP